MAKRLLLVLTVALLGPQALPLYAQPGAHGGIAPAGLLRVAQGGITLEQAVAKVQRATGGRVLDARVEGNDYRIKVLTRDGEVRIVRVDRRTGDIH